MKDMTLINVILDRSGSMSSIASDAVGMFNKFLEEQKTVEGCAEMTLVQFDDKYEVNYMCRPIAECQPLILGETYSPRGWTALYDAIGSTINSVGNELKIMSEEERPSKVLFVILTDGQENSSHEFRGDLIKSMISHQKEKYSWDFIFLGAGIDTDDYSKILGIDKSKCASFAHSDIGMRSAFDTVSSYTASYRRTGDVNMSVGDHLK